MLYRHMERNLGSMPTGKKEEFIGTIDLIRWVYAPWETYVGFPIHCEKLCHVFSLWPHLISWLWFAMFGHPWSTSGFIYWGGINTTWLKVAHTILSNFHKSCKSTTENFYSWTNFLTFCHIHYYIFSVCMHVCICVYMCLFIFQCIFP